MSASKSHKIRWWVVIDGQRVPRTAKMRGFNAFDAGTRELEASGEGELSFAQQLEVNSSTTGDQLLDLIGLESFRVQLKGHAQTLIDDAFPCPGPARLVGVKFCFGDENGNWLGVGLGQTEDGEEDQ